MTDSKAIDDMLAANIICQSKSPWCLPVVMVPKKDGSYGFCTEFQWFSYFEKNLSAITNHWWHVGCFRKKSKVCHPFRFKE